MICQLKNLQRTYLNLKQGILKFYLRIWPEIEKNNKRVHYLFSGDVSEVLNLSENLTEFYESKLKEIEQKYLELYQISSYLKNTDMTKFLDNFFDKTYEHPWGGRKYQGNHFTWMRDKVTLGWLDDPVKFLNSNFYDIVKKYLDKLSIKMIDPKIVSGVIACKLNKIISPDQVDELNNIIKDKTNYQLISPKDSINFIFPHRKP